MNRTPRTQIILDPALLSGSHLPERLVTREEQSQELERWLLAAAETRVPVHLWLHGPSGAGKTVAALRAVANLRDSGRLDGVILNCWEHGTYFELLDALVGQLRILRAEEHRSSLKLERIRKHLASRPFVFILDEIDQMRPLERETSLYNFARLGTVSLIAIANQERALLDLDERVRSRLSPHIITFPAYAYAELVAILHDLEMKALAEDSVGKGVLARIAEIADGDARVAIRLLSNAAHNAERERGRITPSLMEKEHAQARGAKQARALTGLTEDHRILHGIVAERGQITASELWQEYLHRCSQAERKPLAIRTFSNYANRLARTGLVSQEPARVKGRVRLFKMVG